MSRDADQKRKAEKRAAALRANLKRRKAPDANPARDAQNKEKTHDDDRRNATPGN